MSFTWVGTGGAEGALADETLSEIISEIARIVGQHNDPTACGAQSAYNRAVEWLDRRLWNYLLVRDFNLSLVDHRPTVPGQEGYRGLYTVPSTIRDIHSIRVGFPTEATTPGWPIDYWRYQRFADVGGWPEEAGVAEITFHLRVPRTTEATEKVQLLKGPMVTAAILYGQSLVALWNGKPERVEPAMKMAKEQMKDAVAMDTMRFTQEHEPVVPAVWHDTLDRGVWYYNLLSQAEGKLQLWNGLGAEFPRYGEYVVW